MKRPGKFFHIAQHIIIGVFVACICTTNVSSAQSDSLDGQSWIILPIAFFTPETNWGFGAAASWSFRYSPENKNPSLIQGGGAFTLEDQFLLYAPFEIFFPGDRDFIKGEIGFYDYIYQYYGIGNRRVLEDPEFYSARYPEAKLSYGHQASGQTWVGLDLNWESRSLFDLDSSGLLVSERPEGVDGGNLFTLGGFIKYDTRDLIFYPTRGMNHKLSLKSGFKVFGSDWDYAEASFDLRGYVPLGGQVVLALQSLIEGQWGEVPFYKLLELGGPLQSRGIYKGRYRDKALYALQAELRFPFVWRLEGALFSALSGVGSSVGEALIAPGRFTAGLGGRFVLNRRDHVVLRADVGLSLDGIFYYLTVAQAF